MTIDEQIEVMQHFRDGGEVEFRKRGLDWMRTISPSWDFSTRDYGKKPEKKYKPWTHQTITASYVRDKSWPQGFYASVLSVCGDKIIVLNGGVFMHVYYTDLLEGWETRDGGVCGEEVEG